MNNSLALLTNATRMLAAVKNAPEAKKLADMAYAAEHYAKKAKLGQEAIDYAHTIKIQALTLFGEFSKVTEKNVGGRPLKTGNQKEPVSPTLASMGVTKKESSEAQFLAKLKKEKPEKYQEIVDNKKPFYKAKLEEKQEEHRNLPAAELPKGEFNVIYADPPWEYEHCASDSRKIESHYQVRNLDYIKNLKIPSAKNSVLLLWATAPKLEEALQVMNAWEFIYRTGSIWDKKIIGMGYWFRNQHEHLLVGCKGSFSPPDPENRVSSIYSEKRGEHSKKPDYYYNLIESMFPKGKYLELFAKKQFNSKWTVYGNQLL